MVSPVATEVRFQTGNRVSASALRSRIFISLKPYTSPVVGVRAHEWDVKLWGMLEQYGSMITPNKETRDENGSSEINS